jgi:hypothetical protein
MSKAIWTPIAQAELDDVLYYISVKAQRPATGARNYYEIRKLANEYAAKGAPRFIHPDAPQGWFYFAASAG